MLPGLYQVEGTYPTHMGMIFRSYAWSEVVTSAVNSTRDTNNERTVTSMSGRLRSTLAALWTRRSWPAQLGELSNDLPCFPNLPVPFFRIRIDYPTRQMAHFV